MNVFEENLKTAMIQSEYALVLKKRKTNTQYQQFEREYHQLFDRIRGLLDTEHRGLMLELEDLGNALSCMENDWIYQQGVRDCITLLRKVRLL